jgi:phage shock protein E
MMTQTQVLLGVLVVGGLTGLFWAQRARAAETAPPPSSAPKKITLAEFERLRVDTNYVVVDVRTPNEFAAGHVPGAVNIEWTSRDFEKTVARLDKAKPCLVHCASGFRSARAVGKMRQLGFQDLYDFSGGWSEWKKSGKPVEQ